MGQIARQTLLIHNLPLVRSIVTKILRSRPHLVTGARSIRNSQGCSARAASNNDGASQVGAALSRDDLLHEGVLGLAEAIDRYDLTYIQNVEDLELGNNVVIRTNATATAAARSLSTLPKGARLGTYATYWIRARILRAIQSREHFLRFPEHALLASHRLVRAARDMGLEWHYVVDELANYHVISVGRKRLRTRLREAAGIKSHSLFLEAVRIGNMSRAKVVTPLEPWMTPSALVTRVDGGDDELASEAGQEHILDTLSKFLVPREVEVLRLRYGLASSEEEGSSEEVESCGKSKDVASSQQRSVCDYQAEAEDDLFGPDGVLSHYTTTPNEGVAVVATSSSKTVRNKLKYFEITPSPVSQIKMHPTAKKALSPALLSFKEIGKQMQFSGEYSRRTCAQARDKLKLAAEEGRLAESDFLLGW